MERILQCFVTIAVVVDTSKGLLMHVLYVPSVPAIPARLLLTGDTGEE